MKKLLSAWLPVVFWCAVIFYFSAQPQIQTSEFFLWDFIIKKTAHVSEYAFLTVLLFRALHISFTDWQDHLYYLTPGIIGIIYAVSDEFHQRYTPGRTSTLRDILIDTFGISIALFILFWAAKHLRKVSFISSLLSLS